MFLSFFIMSLRFPCGRSILILILKSFPVVRIYDAILAALLASILAFVSLSAPRRIFEFLNITLEMESSFLSTEATSFYFLVSYFHRIYCRSLIILCKTLCCQALNRTIRRISIIGIIVATVKGIRISGSSC